jgi:hypothetical protein
VRRLFILNVVERHECRGLPSSPYLYSSSSIHICCSAQFCCLLGCLLGCARFYLVPCLLHRPFPWPTRSCVDKAPSCLICCHISRDIRVLVRQCYSCSISVTDGGCQHHLTAFPSLTWLPHLAGRSTALASESLFIKVCVTVPYRKLFAEAYVSNSLNNGELSLTYTYLFIRCVRLTAVVDIPCPITKNEWQHRSSSSPLRRRQACVLCT